MTLSCQSLDSPPRRFVFNRGSANLSAATSLMAPYSLFSVPLGHLWINTEPAIRYHRNIVCRRVSGQSAFAPILHWSAKINLGHPATTTSIYYQRFIRPSLSGKLHVSRCEVTKALIVFQRSFRSRSHFHSLQIIIAAVKQMVVEEFLGLGLVHVSPPKS